MTPLDPIKSKHVYKKKSKFQVTVSYKNVFNTTQANWKCQQITVLGRYICDKFHIKTYAANVRKSNI